MADTLITSKVWVKSGASAHQIALCVIAYGRMLTRTGISIDSLLDGDLYIDFLSPAGMVSAGYTLPGGKAAWGFTPKRGQTKVNDSLRDEDIIYVVLHETGHTVDDDKLSKAERASIEAIMPGHPSGWGSGAYTSRPSEGFADTFPRAYAGVNDVLNSEYHEKVPSSNWPTYRSIVGGSGGPAHDGLATIAHIGDTNIKIGTIPGSWANGDWLRIDAHPDDELVQITSAPGTSGPSGTGVDVTALTVNHSSGATVVESSPARTPGLGVRPSAISSLLANTWAVLDLVRQVKGRLLPRNGGTGNGKAWAQGVLFNGYNHTGSTIPLHSLVRSAGMANYVEPTDTAAELDVLGVVVGYLDGYGQLIAEDAPTGGPCAALTAGVTQVLVASLVHPGDYAVPSATAGQAEADAGAGRFGRFMAGGAAGYPVDVRLFGNVG